MIKEVRELPIAKQIGILVIFLIIARVSGDGMDLKRSFNMDER